MAEEDAKHVPFSIFFKGCGFLMFYQMGVMKALQELAPEILRSASKIYGTSSGALIATLVTCGCEIDAVFGYMTETVKNMEGSILGYLYPNNKLILNIQKALEKCLPDNAHQLASGILHIFLTQVSGIQNVVVSKFSSKEEIIQAVTCSCFIPVYNGYIPPSFQGACYIDGALSNPEASFHRSMITVSGFAFDNDICPRDNPGTYLSVYMLQQVFQMSPENFKRLVCCLFPPSHLVSSNQKLI
ncbi:PREDICTED: patatin-like phospholipase domain-containing protein 1 [Gavialis gangeticus]|uniref:patatin-like phospholipase domain-containing protein 1 n=1 Tax=Gavialis gangeticus TaxID=94835 RepID=UPI00092F3464|nr:PREDICTED: patatin-like phospholipase domain-containing protein 1 [Gavialis gangeticus]